MSIYASTFDLGDEHKPRCARMTKIGPRCYSVDDSKPCTCGSAPIKYRESHVLPSDKDERDGVVSLAAIPGHITRDGRDNGTDGYWRPWLRVSIYENKVDATVVLTKVQVEKLRDSLTDWLEHSKRER